MHSIHPRVAAALGLRHVCAALRVPFGSRNNASMRTPRAARSTARDRDAVLIGAVGRRAPRKPATRETGGAKRRQTSGSSYSKLTTSTWRGRKPILQRQERSSGQTRRGQHSDFKTMGRLLRSLKSYRDPIIIPSPRKWQWVFAGKFGSLVSFYFLFLVLCQNGKLA